MAVEKLTGANSPVKIVDTINSLIDYASDINGETSNHFVTSSGGTIKGNLNISGSVNIGTSLTCPNIIGNIQNANYAISAGTANKLGNDSYGRVNKLMYILSGSPRDSETTVGDSKTPVYLSSGTFVPADSYTTLSSMYLPLSGGTMTGNIRIPHNAGIIQNQNDSSNYTTAIKWLKGGVTPASGTYPPQIGQHNTGNEDGLIVLLPYSSTEEPWHSNDGLRIGKTVFKYNDKNVSLEGHTHSYLPLSGGTVTGAVTVTKDVSGANVVATSNISGANVVATSNISGANVVATSNISGATIFSTSGIKVNTGSINVTSSGNIGTVRGNVYTGHGNLSTVEGNIYTTRGAIYTNSGGIYTDNGNIRTEEGNIYTSSGSIYTDYGNIYTDYGHVYTSSGHIFTNNGDVYTNEGDIVTNNGSVSATSISASDSIRLANGEFRIVQGSALIALGDLKLSHGDINVTKGTILVSEGNIKLASGDLKVVSGNISATNAVITSNISAGTINVGNSTNGFVQIDANSVYTTSSSDYAEFFPRGESTEPGDIIALDLATVEESYVKATEGSMPAGIHTDEYAHLIGGEAPEDGESFVEHNLKNFIPVALAGRVKAKIVGPANKGWFVVPSEIPGVGRCSTSRDTAVGILVESDGVKDDCTVRKLRVRVL